jgi:pSer/pThr/pTyr-binding forkhead associated (FHA) protein
LAGAGLTLGRASTNEIALPDRSLSRRHAEFAVTPSGVRVSDLGSRNGVKVNGVPRTSAVLQHGDRLQIGIYTFELKAGPVVTAAPRVEVNCSMEEAANHDLTTDQRVALPEGPKERELAVLYHAAFWITESTDEKALTARLALLLHEGLHVEEAQIFGADGTLQHFSGPNKTKPVLKLADFLKAQFQAITDAQIFLGRDLARHQQKVGNFNYLVAPLRADHSNPNPAPFVVLLRPVDWREFTAGDRVLLQAVAQLWSRGVVRSRQMVNLREENRDLRRQVRHSTLLGESKAMKALRQELDRAAATRVTILLEGETGSGKEVVSQYLHENSPRQNAAFVKVNCAAIPDGLIESELFGHVKGAFTDARADRAGKFSQAHGGTLFLDEIGEMPLMVQSKVLRALENGEIEPLGSEKVVKVDVRIIAATNRDLGGMVAQKEFRQDLYYRLNVLKIHVPPLRDHLDDLELLATTFLQKFCAENGLAALTFNAAAVTALKKHPWPGNVRELRNVVQRCAIAASGPAITPAEILAQLGEKSA